LPHKVYNRTVIPKGFGNSTTSKTRARNIWNQTVCRPITTSSFVTLGFRFFTTNLPNESKYLALRAITAPYRPSL